MFFVEEPFKSYLNLIAICTSSIQFDLKKFLGVLLEIFKVEFMPEQLLKF